MDPKTHKRFLDYQQSHVYFGGTTEPLGATAFTSADAEFQVLDELGDARTDEEEVRFAELSALLHRD